ncbi:hypothetical protein NP233_g7984 [Leucocoprinus birnbaumii]|uniref:Arrestin C-terminal-like domain-containing protein n=1 Tax=Leucocoprinus birnbaumii TaxID=56174 RepID=A0AAD5YSA3_9AGAR|nr:hypothetical protein NP233_g7984 [Leucocoprinus birnbaumii]
MNPPTRPSSPSNDSHIAQDHERPALPPRAQSSSHLADHDASHSKERSHLEILLDSQHLTLKGTGVDVEPTRLSGHVILFLAEDTSLKEITLQFRGKARIPIPSSESLLTSNASSVTYVVCHHEWSFLKGDKKHARTVKAGRHVFPFELQIGGSLPSTIGTSAFGGASVCYKLRATAVRPGLNHNIQAITPVYIDRSFSHEALEYQQTLEIENTWPEKVMYSIVLPHKAWAAGDTLTAILKFSPIAKGVHVSNVRTTIQETTKIYARSGAQENTHVVAAARHAIVDGKATVVDPRHRYQSSSQASSSRIAVTGPSTSGSTSPTGIYSPARPSSPSGSSSAGPSTSTESQGQGEEENGEITVAITIPLPIVSITPTHSVEPIVVSHRVRWSILLRNLDGHTSELRCSLPVHILDHRLLDEARSFSAATRRLVLGSSDIPVEEETDRELPSYAAHIRDRVANMYLPEAATIRVSNPWVNRLESSQGPDVQESFTSFPPSRGPNSGSSTPLEAHQLSHLPQAPGPDGIATLDLLHSELLLSLSDSPLRRDFFTPEPRTPSDQASFELSHPPSQNRSRPQSRHNSRPPSPDGSHHDNASLHPGNNHGRNLQSIFRATMKPFTSLGHPHSLFSRHGNHNTHDDHHNTPPQSSHSDPSTGHRPQRSGIHTPSDHPVTGVDLIHRLFTEVPDYSIASRGFIGGVPPLESMRGLPSYEEAAKETVQRATSSDTDLTSGIAQVGLRSSSEGRSLSGDDAVPRLERRSSFPSVAVPSTTSSQSAD